MTRAISAAAICHRLGINDRAAAYRSRYLRMLIDQHRFPAPFPYLAWRLSSLRWDSRAVDQWFDDRAGHAADHADPADLRAAAQLLDARAERMFQ